MENGDRQPSKNAPGDARENGGANDLKTVVTRPLKSKNAQTGRRFRDINEDDDGYHPYCDGPDDGCIFERDPWS